MKRLFLNYSTFTDRQNVTRILAPCELHPDPLTLDGGVVWKQDNLHLNWDRNEYGEYHGWRNCSQGVANQAEARAPHVKRCRSDDGFAWEDHGDPSIAETVVIDKTESDPERRYKCVYQGIAALGEKGGVEIAMNDYDGLVAAHTDGRPIHYGVFSAVSGDGIHWHDHRAVVIDTYRLWASEASLGHNPDGDKKKLEWWKPGAQGWAGGDSFPCLTYLPDRSKFVAFYRTNIDRRTSLFPNQRRRERGVGRSECDIFGKWGEHRLAMRSDPDWQHALGHGKQDFYQLQVWPCGDVYLGIASVFYWEEDRNHLELAWSPDTIYWERICPYTDLVPHGKLPDFGGGSNYASMRPREIDGKVRVYFGADNGRHNADSKGKNSTLMLAYFEPDRFAGVGVANRNFGIGNPATGILVTRPIEVAEEHMRLNANAENGLVRAELQEQDGKALEGFSLEECDPISVDSFNTIVSWNGKTSLNELANRQIRIRFESENSVLYAFQI
ncbi:MAG: hypothetical protein QGF00_10630 [Planctomycetota bacterium]|jgi:hypothetical protein|nr:hypothetical protein [Planctomycetota bacterium]MDP7250044.1 hypothetical protein [Planctomycetota bacterium]